MCQEMGSRLTQQSSGSVRRCPGLSRLEGHEWERL